MRDIFIGDFETTPLDKTGRTQVCLWSISNKDKTKRFRGVSLDEMFQCISHFGVSKIMFHNLSWDGTFIVHYLLENGYTFKETSPTSQHLDAKQFTWLKDDMGTLYTLDVCLPNSKRIRFGDTAKLLMSSVDKLGKALGLPKLTTDYSKLRPYANWDDVPEELKEYIFRDVDVVVDSYTKFKENYGSHGITLAGTAMKDFKEHYGRHQFAKDFGGSYKLPKGKKEMVYEVLTKEQWDDLKQAYKGGLTIGNESVRNLEVNCENGMSVDKNSLYPHIMKNYKLPYGKPLKFKPQGDYVELIRIFVYRTHKIDDQMPSHLHNPKATHLSKVKYVDEITDTYYTYTREELEELKLTYELKEGYNYRVVDITYFQAKYIFTSWVNEKEHLKIFAPTEIERLYHKTVLNSLYGKNGEHYLKGKTIIVYDPEKELPGTRYGLNEEYVEQKEVDETENLSYIPLAIFITSYSRVELLQAIRKNKHIFLYADTDSMYCSDIPTGIHIHETEFGAWKPEVSFTKFKWIKPKAYLAQMKAEYKKTKEGTYEWKPNNDIKRAIAGLTKEQHGLVNFSNFNAGTTIKQGKRQKRNVKGGLILVDIDYTL